MAKIAVRAVCSECAYADDRQLTADDKEITCPNCGRRMPSLKKEEVADIERIQKKQRTMTIVSIVLFAFTVGFVIWWVGSPVTWVSTDSPKYWKDAGTTREMNVPGMVLATAFAIGALVCGILSSRKKYTVEY